MYTPDLGVFIQISRGAYVKYSLSPTSPSARPDPVPLRSPWLPLPAPLPAASVEIAESSPRTGPTHTPSMALILVRYSLPRRGLIIAAASTRSSSLICSSSPSQANDRNVGFSLFRVTCVIDVNSDVQFTLFLKLIVVINTVRPASVASSSCRCKMT
jgi:hypothetical protein